MRRILALAAVTALFAVAVPPGAMASQDSPVVGDCYDYGAFRTKQITSDAPSVDCAAKHSAETYFTGTVPASFGLPSKARPAARLAVSRPCTVKGMNAHLGMAERVLPSRFTTYVVFPSDAQWRAGARWFRCDAVLQGGTSLVKYAGSAKQYVASAPASQFDFCTPGKPSANKTRAYPCLKPKKNWILVQTQDLGRPGQRFPGKDSVVRQTLKICAKAGKAYNGAQRFPNWWAIWPLAGGWNEGRREAMCFVPYRQYETELKLQAAGAG